MTHYEIYETTDYLEWFDNECRKSRFQIFKRLHLIMNSGHFGHHKDLGDGLSELKFNDGRRIYYIIIPESLVVLLLGGNKNGQDKDIKKARGLINKAKESIGSE